MIDFSAASIGEVMLHLVGNKKRNEMCFESRSFLDVDKPSKQILLNYFLKSFENYSTVYRFNSESENLLLNLAPKSFESSAELPGISVEILQHLFEQSEHPHIKSGELFVARIEDIFFESGSVSALGIFKAETKQAFMQFSPGADGMNVNFLRGVHVGKLDKGCLIFNIENEDGYRVLSVDNNPYDTQYWYQDFLNIQEVNDMHYQTKNYIQLCDAFSAKAFDEKEDAPKKKIEFMQRSVNYLNQHNELNADEFSQEVIAPELQGPFTEFKKEYQTDNNLLLEDEFTISKPALRVGKKKIKNLISLDTDVQIKLGYGTSGDSFIERGFDNQKNMYFYKVYFNKELNG